MKILRCVCLIVFLMVIQEATAQKINLKTARLEAANVTLSFEKVNGKKAAKVLIDTTIKGFDEPTFVKLKGTNFKNGTIEVKVLSRLAHNAPEWARGFIGLAFRIDDKNAQFESVYIRPTNGRADDQIRRNHSIQYFSYPDYKFDRLRKEAPEKYESYADMGLNEWITLKLEVQDAKAQLFINGNKQPALIVNDLKLGGNNSGSIGLWVGNWTEGYFRDLKIVKN